MEKLENKYNNLIKVFKQLKIAVEKYKKPSECADQADIDLYMTALIKRFELTFELTWKFLKYYLKTVQGQDVLGSKSAIRVSEENYILTLEETKKLLDIVEVRNTLTHDYDEDAAKALCNLIVVEYYPLFSKVIPRLETLTKKT